MPISLPPPGRASRKASTVMVIIAPPYHHAELVSASNYKHPLVGKLDRETRSEEDTSELQSLMCNSYGVFCLKQKNVSPYVMKTIPYNTSSELVLYLLIYSI